MEKCLLRYIRMSDLHCHEAWLEHYRSHYPDSKITTEKESVGR